MWLRARNTSATSRVRDEIDVALAVARLDVL